MVPDVLLRQVRALNERGWALEVWEEPGQIYVFVPKLGVPKPPWDRDAYEILIAVPAAYDSAGLDGFYLALPYTFEKGTHPKVNGKTAEIRGQQWQLVSWHYLEDKPWLAGHDTLETHLAHCRGFFRHRGARNAYR